MMSKKQLEIVLSKLKNTEDPKKELEQYVMPSALAAAIINIASVSGDIERKVVFDFGCGTGMLSVGAALAGAEKVLGVDIDKDIIKIARMNAESLGLDIKLLCDDIENFSGECDTVLQNPPFGMRSQKKMDRIFLKKALECGKKVYSLHRGGYKGEKQSKTRKFLTSFIESNGGKVLLVKEFKFDAPYMFKFHKKPKVSYNVDMFVIEKVD